MEQRTLRLGDILDDYCPRERRVTNHAIVAMIEEDVKQTRCTTCEAEHAYKGGKAPRRRKKDAGVVLYEEVLAGMPDAGDGHAAQAAVSQPSTAQVHMAESNGNGIDESAEQPEETGAEEAQVQVEDGPFHRRLIRATLPRPEGQKEVRQVPDFTIRHNVGRGTGHNPYRGAGGNGAGNGNRPFGGGGGGRRFAGGNPGGNPSSPGARGGRGGRPGFGAGNQQRQGGGPSTGSGRGPSAGAGRGGRNKRSR